MPWLSCLLRAHIFLIQFPSYFSTSLPSFLPSLFPFQFLPQFFSPFQFIFCSFFHISFVSSFFLLSSFFLSSLLYSQICKRSYFYNYNNYNFFPFLSFFLEKKTIKRTSFLCPVPFLRCSVFCPPFHSVIFSFFLHSPCFSSFYFLFFL